MENASSGRIPTGARVAPRLLQLLWRQPLVGAALALAAAAVVGLLVGLTMRRGPTTAAQALIVMATGLVVGLAAGLVWPSRWALLLAAVGHALGVELGRLGTVGPTAGAIRLNEAYGILALILGRGFHGLLALMPMILGTSLGAALARPLSGGLVAATQASDQLSPRAVASV